MMEKLQFKVGTKDESIRLRLTKEEKKIIKDLAAEKGWTKVDKTRGQNRDKTQNQEEKEKEKEKEEENLASASFVPSASSAPNCPIDFDSLGRQASANHADQIMREYATAAAKEKAREVTTSRPTDNSR